MSSGDCVTLTKAAVTVKNSVSAVKLYPEEYSCNMYRMKNILYPFTKTTKRSQNIAFETVLLLLMHCLALFTYLVHHEQMFHIDHERLHTHWVRSNISVTISVRM